MSMAGLRVLSLESRRAAEMAELIRRQGGVPLVAPSMREVPLEDNNPAFQFAERLFAGEFEMAILLTGVGTRQLNRVLAGRYGETAFADGLRRVTVVARGPSPRRRCARWASRRRSLRPSRTPGGNCSRSPKDGPSGGSPCRSTAAPTRSS
jgi:uroporphyrinogen-III synthase